MSAPSVTKRLRKLALECEQSCRDFDWTGRPNGKGKPNYRLIYSSPATFAASQTVMILGSNPGGDRRTADISDPWKPFKNRNYSAYLDECWGDYKRGKHPIQKSARSVATAMAGTETKGDQLLRKIPTGNLIPFRSEKYPGDMPLKLRKCGVRFGPELIDLASPSILVLLSSRKELWEWLMDGLGHSRKPDWFCALRPGRQGHRGAGWTLRETVIRQKPRPLYVWALPGLNAQTTDPSTIVGEFHKRLRNRQKVLRAALDSVK